MSNTKMKARYLVISPAKDEAERIEKTIQAMTRQTILPMRWVVVDDGSQDKTSEIVRDYASKHNWIHLHRIERDATRKLGSAEIQAFATGFELVKNVDFDFVVKLDCDLDLPADYFESLLEKFHADPRLGIASGQFYEDGPKGWKVSWMPPYHVAGASKVVRAQCFEDIGGFPTRPGWDTADEIKARFRGWKTRHFPELSFYHLRNEGAALGFLRTNLLHGEIYYVCGGGALFFSFKVFHRMFTSRPFVLSGLALTWGYLGALLARKKRLVNESEREFYKNALNQRIWARFSRDEKQRESAAQNGFAT
jgi:poly-beta-1,6-N-acetyl-D-glucosamine synthase